MNKFNLTSIGLFILGFVAITSVAQAEVCEIKMSYCMIDDQIILSMEDKAEAEADADADEGYLISFLGGNFKAMNCQSVIQEIKKSGKKSLVVEGREIPVKLVHTIEL